MRVVSLRPDDHLVEPGGEGAALDDRDPAPHLEGAGRHRAQGDVRGLAVARARAGR